MVQHKPRIKRAFLAASGRAELQPIKDELQRRGIEACTAYELPAAGKSVSEHVETAIREADLLVAVVGADTSVAQARGNVFFEMGLARGLGKQILLLASPKYGQLPSDLAGSLYVRADPDNREAIGFALDQILASSGRKPRRPTKSAPAEHPLGHEADRYLELLRRSGPDIAERKLKELVVDILKATGVSAVTRSSSPDTGADIAVWSDDLESIVGNPVIIEVKSRILDSEHLRRALEQVEAYRQGSNTQWALLIVPAVSSALSAAPSFGAVLLLSLAELLEKLRSRSFAETVRELRNARVHGGAT